MGIPVVSGDVVWKKGGLLDRWEFCAAGQPLEEAWVVRCGSGSGWVVLNSFIKSLLSYIEVKLMAAVFFQKRTHIHDLPSEKE